MGMIQHEAPHIYDKGVIPYPAPYKDKSLESGMVLSIETDLKYDDVGLSNRRYCGNQKGLKLTVMISVIGFAMRTSKILITRLYFTRENTK